MTILITLDQIRVQAPCETGWRTLLRSKPGDGPFPLAHIVHSNGLADALWCTRCLPEHARLWRLFAVWCARQVPQSDICLQTLDVAERFANGQATARELAAAWDAARDAAGAAAIAAASYTAWEATRAASWAAALDAAGAAARDAARAAAWDAASDAARAAAWDAAWGAAWDAAWDAARSSQTAEFLRIIEGAAP